MKKQKGTDIRARIDEDLKQEFNDLFGDMSKKMIELIETAIDEKKAIYLKAMMELCSKDPECIEILDDVINYYCNAANSQNQDKAGLTVKESSILYTLNRGSGELIKRYGSIGSELFTLVNRDLIHGLYKISEKDSIEERINRLERNRENVMSYILNEINRR